MWAMAVVVIDVLSKDGFELVPVKDQHPVEALPTDGADEALRKGVGPRLTGQSGPRPQARQEEPGRLSLPAGAASKGAQFFFVAANLGGKGLETLAKMVELDHDAGQSVGLSVAHAALFDEGAQLRPSIEGGFGDLSTLGDGGEGDRLASFDEVRASCLDSGDEVRVHADCASEMSRSRRSIRRR